MTVVILEDAAEDMESGRRFYEEREVGIGDYFVESILSDLDSLILYAGIHRYAMALQIAHFNFCRVHSAHKMTPAVAQGLTDHTWTISELLTADAT